MLSIDLAEIGGKIYKIYVLSGEGGKGMAHCSHSSLGTLVTRSIRTAGGRQELRRIPKIPRGYRPLLGLSVGTVARGKTY